LSSCKNDLRSSPHEIQLDLEARGHRDIVRIHQGAQISLSELKQAVPCGHHAAPLLVVNANT
jgi:hypothetical protein